MPKTAHPIGPSPEAAWPSGKQFEIQRGTQRAVITEVGAGLHSFSLDGQELLDTYAPHEMASGGRGQALLPWPGRIADGQYTFAGVQQCLPLTEPTAHHAIHGLTRWLNWNAVSHKASHLVMEVTLHAQPGYPFVLHLQERYTLTEQGLEIQTTARNIGAASLPYGAGHHPYFTVGTQLVNDAILHLPARSYFPTNERAIPLLPPVPVEGTPFDFRKPRPIGTLVLDTSFTNLTFERGWSQVTLSAPAGQPRITLTLDSTHQALHLWSISASA